MTEQIPKSNYYSVIYADPPWAFTTFSETGHGRSAEAHYDCMSLEKLKQLPVANWAAENCILLMWARDPMLLHALELVTGWSFKYKTVGFYWAKLNKSAPEMHFNASDFFTGLGYWTRANVEQCLLATRGKPKRRSKDVKRLIIAPRREHSRKPVEIYASIERLADGPYLELFARSNRPGWDSWGTEAGLFDKGPVETRRRPSRNKNRLPVGLAKGSLL